MELMRQGKDDVKITGRQELLFPRGDPALPGLSLAFGTNDVSRQEVQPDAFIIAVLARVSRTLVDMTAKRGGAALRDGAHHFKLLEAEPFRVALVGNQSPCAKARKISATSSAGRFTACLFSAIGEWNQVWKTGDGV